MNEIELLEQQLDSFDAAKRKDALAKLWDLAKADKIALAQPGSDVNLHSHTFYSYNACGYSPSKFAWLARKRGLAAAGIVDFDVLDALEEFWAAGKLLGLKRGASLESRVFVPEFSTRVINSPGEPGIAYHMGVGFPREIQHPLLSQMRRTAEARNRELVRRVNDFLAPVGLDYDKDVKSLTPNGNATERHICEAYSQKGDAAFWKSKLGDCPADAGKLQALIRSKTMKKGGPGYVPPGKDSFPLMADMNRFVQEVGAIPTLTWLDGTSEGEKAIEELIQAAMFSGAAAINVIPDRNYTPGVKDQKLQNLYDVVALAEKHDFPVIVGTEMNTPGNKFVDDFNTAELKPLVPVVLKGAHIVYAHSVLQRESGLGYLSGWAKKSFASTAAKNDFFEKMGRQLQPAAEDRLRALPSDVTPADIFARIKCSKFMPTTNIPEKQRALQLVAPDQLRVNESKPVFQPGPHQILCRVEVCGLCFSDLKLLKQFSGHARKSGITAGIEAAALAQMPHYVPGDKPVVPGHETVVRIVKVGPEVKRFKAGERYLVQTDYRWLPTKNSNSAFGYNFEGALQEFVLVDERVITAPDGESMFIPAPEDLSASAIALCEPWACVEDAYVEKQRQTFKRDGKTLIVAAGEPKIDGAGKITYAKPSELPTGFFDDVIYLGSDAAVAEKLFANVGTKGLFVIVQGGKKFGRTVVTAVGRVHYGGIRITGTAGGNVADALAAIPATAEIRPNDKINIIGAAGPMGTMHVIRDLCQGVPSVTIFAGDLSDERLVALRKLSEPLAQKNELTLKTYNPSKDKLAEKFNYIVLMAPVPALVAQAVKDAAPKAIINIFAGIPAEKTGEIDLDTYIERRCYFIGTSGSTLDDMKAVLKKVASRQLDTNLSVAAIAGLDGAVDGIRAVEKNTMPGKIIVYPFAKGLKLTALTEAGKEHPGVARSLNDGQWNKNAEEALKKEFGAQ